MLKRKMRTNNKGIAIFEIIPILIIFILFINYTLGFFGAIHAGILNSIGARNYAFDTFRHRSNVVYFRINIPPDHEMVYPSHRFHSITSENAPRSTSGDSDFYATERRISSSGEGNELGTSSSDHVNPAQMRNGGIRATKDGVDPIWIKTSYGICIRGDCGG